MDSNLFSYEDYKIPIDLINLTGGGIDTWDVISKGHMDEYSKYSPINPEHSVVEIGCGIGRDAIQLTKHLTSQGKYIGIDIIEPSINWCQNNISPKFPNFEFHYFDINSQIHNPSGKSKTTQFTLPIRSGTIDRIILQSVFTHMFEDDIVHYLKEFRRVLKPSGKVFASFFIIDPTSLKLAKKTKSNLNFRYKLNSHCYINDEKYPEGAVGYTKRGLNQMLNESRMLLDQPIHYGFWCGRQDTIDGQDIVIMKPAKKSLPEMLKEFTNKLLKGITMPLWINTFLSQHLL